MKSRSFISLLLLMLLAGCDQVEPRTPAAAVDVTAGQAEPKLLEPVATAAPLKPVAKVKAEPNVLALAPAQLDLSLPETIDFEQVERLEEPKLLPQLLQDKASDSQYQLSGRLINGEKGEDYWDSVEGAEIQIQIRH